jgi:hypothetical protein
VSYLKNNYKCECYSKSKKEADKRSGNNGNGETNSKLTVSKYAHLMHHTMMCNTETLKKAKKPNKCKFTFDKSEYSSDNSFS